MPGQYTSRSCSPQRNLSRRGGSRAKFVVTIALYINRRYIFYYSIVITSLLNLPSGISVLQSRSYSILEVVKLLYFSYLSLNSCAKESSLELSKSLAFVLWFAYPHFIKFLLSYLCFIANKEVRYKKVYYFSYSKIQVSISQVIGLKVLTSSPSSSSLF